jgi:hypothetical protein
MFEYTDPVKLHWTTAAQDSFEDIKPAILLDPCLMQFNHQQLIVLCTDFSSRGFGYVLCQPGNNKASTAAMIRRGFLIYDQIVHSCPSPGCVWRKMLPWQQVRLHSHLGRGFSGDYAMNKCCYYLFGQQFVWVTNCYGIKFILSYDGANHAILCLQMLLMGWDTNIIQRNDH